MRPKRPRGAPALSSARCAAKTGGRGRALMCALDEPGTSATTKLRSSDSETTPRLGDNVVNG
jgi:hypothetical protein